MNYSICRTLEQLVYRRRIRDFEYLKEVLQTCWEQIGQDVIYRPRYTSTVSQMIVGLVATGGGHIEHRFD